MVAVLLDFIIGEPRRFHPLVGSAGWLTSIKDVQGSIFTPPHLIERLSQQLPPLNGASENVCNIIQGNFDIPVQFLLADDLVGITEMNQFKTA